MGIIEFLKHSGREIDADAEVWFYGWEDSYVYRSHYAGWKGLSDSDHKFYSLCVLDYLEYMKEFERTISDHHYLNKPMAVTDYPEDKGEVR